MLSAHLRIAGDLSYKDHPSLPTPASRGRCARDPSASVKERESGKCLFSLPVYSMQNSTRTYRRARDPHRRLGEVKQHRLVQGLRAAGCPREDFSPVSDLAGHRGKIVPSRTSAPECFREGVLLGLPEPPMGIPRAAVSPCRVLQSVDWEGEQGHLELTLVDARTVIGCHRTRGPGGRERWAHLAGEVVS